MALGKADRHPELKTVFGVGSRLGLVGIWQSNAAEGIGEMLGEVFPVW